MVGQTPALGNVKTALRILSKIHHPGPLTKQESKKLLNSINSSFRKHLDQEHPWHENGAEPKSPSTVRTTTQHRPTDHHLRSILSNPLFGASQSSNQPTAIIDPLSHHLQVFDLAVARGMMDLNRATGFLMALRKELPSSFAPAEMQESMARSGAGRRVVQWLRASGSDNNLDFVGHQALVRALVPFLYAEGLKEVAWAWLSRLSDRLGNIQIDTESEKALSGLYAAILVAEIPLSQQPLDSKYSAFLRAYQILPPNDAVIQQVKQQWHSISYRSTMDTTPRPKPSTQLFDDFVDAGRPWGRKIDIAHLELRHPSSPSHSSALNFLHNLPADVFPKAKSSPGQERYYKRMFNLGSDTMHRLEVVGLKEDASWVDEFMSRTFFRWSIERELGDSHLKSYIGT
jgi:hypothetical protein